MDRWIHRQIDRRIYIYIHISIVKIDIQKMKDIQIHMLIDYLQTEIDRQIDRQPDIYNNSEDRYTENDRYIDQRNYKEEAQIGFSNLKFSREYNLLDLSL